MALLAVAVSGCVLEPVPLDGLACPCAAPYVCDDGSGLCVEPSVAVCGRAAARPSAIEIASFERWWVTAEQARLRWSLAPGSVATELAVDVASSIEVMNAGEFETVDGTVNPELGRGFLPGTEGTDPVISTLMRELMPDTVYVMRLVVTDEAGRIACSPSIPVRTNLSPRTSVPIFEDALPAASYLRPDCATLVLDGTLAAEGEGFINQHYRCEQVDAETANAVCGEPVTVAPECWENVGVLGAAIDVRGMSAGDFDRAYIEVSVAVDDVSSAFWAEAAVTVGGEYYEVTQVTVLTDGAYHRYEIPLSQLGRRCDGGSECVWGTPFTRATLGDTLGGFRVGMGLSDGATLRIDSLRLRW